jgi:hypothetical protein
MYPKTQAVSGGVQVSTQSSPPKEDQSYYLLAFIKDFYEIFFSLLSFEAGLLQNHKSHGNFLVTDLF